MALLSCRTCGKPVADTAEVCPHCGDRYPHSKALNSARLLLEPSEEIEKATSHLLNLEAVIKESCRSLRDSQGFHLAAIQLIRFSENIIETMCGTGLARAWSGVAKHYLEEDKDLRDIQADMALAAKKGTPRVEIIGGWDERFDKWLFDNFGHERLVRIFVPMLLARRKSGEVDGDWFNACRWRPVAEKRSDTGWAVILEMQLPEGAGDLTFEVIGTAETGYDEPGRRISPAEGEALANLAARQALSIHSARLPHALEVIARCVTRILRADATSFHYTYDSKQSRYLYEAAWGEAGQRFLKSYRPQDDWLRHQVLGTLADESAAGKPIPLQVAPVPSRVEEGAMLARLYPELQRQGIKTVVAFPFFVGGDEGVLHVLFRREHRLTADEVDWVQLTIKRASDALEHYFRYKRAHERARKLDSLHSVVRSIVSKPEDKDLLRHIAWNTLNTLAADVVTIYEYIESEGRFLIPPDIAGRLLALQAMETTVYKQDAPSQVIERGEDTYSEESEKDPTFNKEIDRTSINRDCPPFVIREKIKSSAGIILRVGEERVGVMFINYRRPHSFPPEEREIIEALAATAAVAIKNRRLLEALSAGDREIITTLDLEQVLKLIAKRAVGITRAQLGIISRWEPAIQELVIQATYGDETMVSPKWRHVKMNEGITGRVAANKEPALVNDLGEDERHRDYFAYDGSALSVPLVDRDARILGVLSVLSRRRGAFDQKHQRMLEALANHAVIAIHNAESQKQLAHHETMATLGSLASTLVHKFNDKAGAIRVYAQDILERGDDFSRRKASDIQSVAEWILQEAKQMSIWLREKPQRIELSQLIRRVVSQARLPPNVEARDETPPNLPKVIASAQQLGEVFLNLIHNAVVAMPDGGVLAVGGKEVELDGKLWAVTWVRDTGIGIPGEDLERIFQPGYTTKKGSQGGLGFGLWWSRTYAERLGGQLTVESKLGEGTVFTLTLPSPADRRD